MKRGKILKRMAAAFGCLLLCGAVGAGGFLLGKATAPKPPDWEEAQFFLATVVEASQDGVLLVEGSSLNDQDHRGRFAFSLEGVPLTLNGTFIQPQDLAPGRCLRVLYDGAREGEDPVSLPRVLRVDVDAAAL